ncbi:hypothetical protein BASA81_003918 [Batrachochytrium salamandrivorans]|nr:hypothetical protein BASA81_003918 [Batrachochytrium salamandrivorans]
MRFAWLVACLLVSSQASLLPLETTYESSAPCSGLYSAHQFTGCTSLSKSAAPGKLRWFPTKPLLMEHEFTQPTSVVIPQAVWCKLSSAELQSLPTPLVVSVAVVNDTTTVAAAGECASKLTASLLFPVNRLPSWQDSLRLISRANALSSPHSAAFPFYMGRAGEGMNSSTCLAMSKCDPVGGLSVWGTVRNPPLQVGEEVLLLTASLDAKSFFHDLGFGFRQSAGDVAIALTVAKLLSAMPITAAWNTRIAVALFQGESFNRIGSRRFLADVEHGQCDVFSSSRNETCLAPPNYSLEWTKLGGNITRIRGVVALRGMLSSQLPVRVSQSSNASDLANELQSRMQLELSRVLVTSETTSDSDDSSTLQSFAENANWTSRSEGTTGGISLSTATLEDDDYLGEDTMPAEFDPSRACAMATAIARTLYYVASFDHTNQTAMEADCQYLQQVLQCFGQGNVAAHCQLGLELMNLTQSQMNAKLLANGQTARFGFASNPLPAYAGVYRPSRVVTNGVKLREQLARNLLADACLGKQDYDESFLRCKDDVVCRDAWENATCVGLASNASKICLRGQCACSPVSYHDAYSTSLTFLPKSRKYVVQQLKDELWTEPVWESQEFTTFAVSNTESLVVAWCLGIAITLASLGLVRVAQRSEKFKLS